jgi:sRNA-binding protein
MSQDHNEVIRLLCELYPKSFFIDSKQRRPLKQNILADIEKLGDPQLAGFDVEAALGWYMSHIGYDMACQVAGTQRVDLDGRPVGKITASEAREAKERVAMKHQEMTEQRSRKAPIASRTPPSAPLAPSILVAPSILERKLDDAISALTETRKLLQTTNPTVRNALVKSAMSVADACMQEILQEIDKKGS